MNPFDFRYTPIQVCPPEGAPWVPDANPGAMTLEVLGMATCLFRGNTHIPEAMSEAYARAPSADSLRIVLAACSVGAEADTMMALHNRDVGKGMLDILGLDISPLALKTADRGRYVSVPSPAVEADAQEAILEEFDFAFTRQSHQDCEWFDIDATPVRGKHEVTFEQHDLLDAPHNHMQGDLVHASNVLLYFDPDEVLIALSNLANMVPEHGVLNLGEVRLDRDEEALLGKLGLQGIARHSTGQSFMFVRK